MDAELQGKRVTVHQVRSANCSTQRMHRTLQALGLGRIGKSCEHTLNPALWGMLRKVAHLVRVIEVK